MCCCGICAHGTAPPSNQAPSLRCLFLPGQWCSLKTSAQGLVAICQPLAAASPSVLAQAMVWIFHHLLQTKARLCYLHYLLNLAGSSWRSVPVHFFPLTALWVTGQEKINEGLRQCLTPPFAKRRLASGLRRACDWMQVLDQSCLSTGLASSTEPSYKCAIWEVPMTCNIIEMVEYPWKAANTFCLGTYITFLECSCDIDPHKAHGFSLQNMPAWAFSSAWAVIASTGTEYPAITNSSHRRLKEKPLIALVLKFLSGLNYIRKEFWDYNV